MRLIDQVKTAFGRAMAKIHAGDEKLAARTIGATLTSGVRRVEVTSSSFVDAGPLGRDQTVDGANLPPVIRWGDVPNGTRAMVLVCEDPDAPLPKPFVHWLVYDASPDMRKIDGEKLGRGVPGKNSTGKAEYAPAAPPLGHGLHHYHFQIFALDRRLGLAAGATRDEVVEGMRGHVLAAGEIIGTYERG